MVVVNTFDERVILRPGGERPSVLVLCAKHGQALGVTP
jgi:hypothetical protein